MELNALALLSHVFSRLISMVAASKAGQAFR